MTGMMMTALKNRVMKHGDHYEFHLHNVRVNGEARGCSGFIKNTLNGKIIYVSTEGSNYGPLADKVMYRTAESLNDYTGGINRWGKRKDDAFIGEMTDLLR